MKIVLCNPAVNLEYSHSRKGMYPPLGLLSLATYLESVYRDGIELKILDADIDPITPRSLMGANIVGFHTNSFNYSNCLKLAKAAKDSGSTVIFGGYHATVLWKNIMRNRDYVDYVIINEGERTLSLLIGKVLKKNKMKFEEIPNLIYRVGKNKNNFKVSQKFYKNSPRELIVPSRKYINMENYIENYRKVYLNGPLKFQRPSSVYSSKGCLWRDRTGGCIFCARLERGVVFRDIDELWGEILDLKENYNIDSIWDISDDNLNIPEWFKKYASRKPASLSSTGFFIYSRVNAITDDIIPYLHKLNVYEVYLGFESGDQEILSKTAKGISTDIAIQVAKRLKKAGIFYFPSFVIGLPGETEESLRNTFSFAKRIGEIGPIYRMSATILQPVPGSRAFGLLLKDRRYGKSLSLRDDLSIEELEKRWLRQYTGIDYETAQKYQNLINTVISRTATPKTFGARIP